MSRTWWLGLSAWCVVRGAWGQDLAQLRQRAESLGRAWQEAQLFATLQDSLRRTAPPPNMDRAQSGELTVFADPSRLPLQRATTAAWSALDRFYGTAAAALAGRPLVLRVLDALQKPSPGHGERWVLATTDLELPELTLLLVRNAPLPPNDARLRAWLPLAIVPPHDTTRERAQVYVDLVTSHADVSRRCYAGELAACRVALAVDSVAHPLLEWWTAADRRRLVPILLETYFLNESNRRARTNDCLERGVDSACLELLASIPRNALPRPLGAGAQLGLLQLAIEMGGRSAYERLRADSTAPVGQRLAAAAGLPLDTLVATWRRTVISARPRRVALPWWTAFFACAWTGAFATMALRSSRWRA